MLILLATKALASDIMVIDGYAPASLTTAAKTAAVYMTLMNHSAVADRLIKISSPAAEGAAAHQTLDENGIMKMRPLETLELAPNASVKFAPGGSHIMLTGLRVPLKEGEQLSLVLSFEKAGDIAVSVPVVGKLGAAASTAHQHTVQ